MPFDQAKADRAVNFFERVLVHTSAQWSGHPFILLDWQRDIVSRLFGTVNADGMRQYRTAYIEIPKKQGKSEMAAGIALYLLIADGEEAAEVYGAAGDRDQASIVFNVAADMVRFSPALTKRCKLIPSTKRIIHIKTRGIYRAIKR